ncbi:hypothetical protein ACFXPM_12990 [Streptomyces sp. NPDC059095]|uniref:hypothetical protein n=1 Tax=Streptomyces sp. NPDC059095 TaxID=3346726 RepID=UPI0036B7D6C8
MTTLALPGMMIFGRLVLLVSALAWLIIAAALAVSNVRSYRRSIAVAVRCAFVTRLSPDKFSYLLRRRPMRGEDKTVRVVIGGDPRLTVDEVLDITYDPKNADLVYLGQVYPRFTHGKAIVLFSVLGIAFPLARTCCEQGEATSRKELGQLARSG